MYSFTNDYSEGAHPKLLEAILNSSQQQNAGYGEDEHCSHATKLILKEINRPEAAVHYLSGGTQTNLLAISAFLRPHQAVISADTGHINVHETGAIEGTGHKVLTCRSQDGKLTPSLIQGILDEHVDEHMVQPKLVYISNSTEVGTIYTKAELQDLHQFCSQKALYLYMDGARLGAALCAGCNDLKIQDIAALTDAFYIGGTKNGALMGEALVICKPELQEDFRFLMKQKGALSAKGFVIGMQFEAFFQDGLYYELAKHASEMADLLRKGIVDCGYSFYSDSPTNQVFPILPCSVIGVLEESFSFHHWAEVDEGHMAIRVVTSWATKEEEVQRFIGVLREHS